MPNYKGQQRKGPFKGRLYLSLLDISHVPDTFGILVISTSKGIMTAEEAFRKGEGGEFLANIS